MREYWKDIPGNMFDFENFYRKVAESLPNNCTIAEVGVADGKSALALAYFLNKLGKKFTLYMIDSLDYGGKDQLRTIVNNAIKAGIEGVEVYPYSSLEAAAKFPNDHFDFIFLDSSHLYKETKEEIREWYPKIKEDGILSGHDYFGHEEVNRAVNEVIPKTITRDPIPDQQEFEPEQVLFYENTSLNFGVWFMKKKWYVKLK